VLLSIILLYVHRKGVTSAAFVKKAYIEMKKEFVFQNLNVKSMNLKPHHQLQDVRQENCITNAVVVVANLVVM
jgi:hypothetical protein